MKLQKQAETITKPVSRRNVVKAMAATGIIASGAGCLGGENGATGSVDDLETTSAEEWPDLSGEEVYIVAESSTDPYAEWFNTVSARFEAVTGADVEVEFAGDAGGYRARMAELVQAGDPPEVCHMPINRAASLERDGLLADHTEVVEYWEEFWGESYSENHRLQIDGEDMYLPMHSNVLTLWHRGDVIDTPPQTWEEELEVAAEVDEGEGGTRGHVLFPTISNWTNDIWGFTRVWSSGGNLCEYDGDDLTVVMDEGDNLDAWVSSIEHDMALSEYSNTNEGMGTDEMNQQIAIEEAYMSYWQGSYPKLNAINAGVPFAEDIRPAAPPTPGDNDLVSWGNVQGQAVFEGANVEAGLEFLKFLAHPENAMGYYFADDLHQDPLLEAITTNERFEEQVGQMAPEWSFPEDSKIDWMPNGIDLAVEVDPYNPYAGELAFENLYGQVLFPVMTEGEDPEEAVRDVADHVRDLIGSDPDVGDDL